MAKARKKSSSTRPASAGRRKGTPLIKAQPQSGQQAALQGGMFLHTNDAWSRAYFNAQDLHHLERELLGGKKATS
jgi:hypothetical protein